MTCDVILSKKDNKFIARVKEWPEVIAEDTTRNAVIRQVKTKLLDYLTKQIEVIKVEVPLPNETGNPWLDKFGWFKDDPTFDDLQDEIAMYRNEVDQQAKQFVSSKKLYVVRDAKGRFVDIQKPQRSHRNDIKRKSSKAAKS